MRKSGSRRRLFLPLLLFFTLLVPLSPASREPILRVVDGQVKEVSVSEGKLWISFRHPANGREEEMGFKVDRRTGFSGVLKMEELETDDPVSIDYQEDETAFPRAVRVKRIPLRGVPIES